MPKWWRYQDKDEYNRRKAGDILKRYRIPEIAPEQAPREPVTPLAPRPAPAEPRPSQFVPPTGADIPLWPGLVGRGQEPMPAWMQQLREIANLSWEKWGQPTMGHWMKGMAAHPTARLWMPGGFIRGLHPIPGGSG